MGAESPTTTPIWAPSSPQLSTNQVAQIEAEVRAFGWSILRRREALKEHPHGAKRSGAPRMRSALLIQDSAGAVVEIRSLNQWAWWRREHGLERVNEAQLELEHVEPKERADRHGAAVGSKEVARVSGATSIA